jgi:hypothetical protein
MAMQPLMAQKYNTIAGVRIGDDFGISAAQRIANKTTIELNIQPGTFAGRQMTSLLAKQHYSLLTKRFNFLVFIPENTTQPLQMLQIQQIPKDWL